MFDFRIARQGNWPKVPPKPFLLVDGEMPDMTSSGPVSGSMAYVRTVNVKNFAAVNSRLDVEVLSIFEARVTDITPLATLTRLKHLKIEWATKTEDISPLSQLTSLESLSLCHMTKARDLGPVSALSRLTSFAFTGGFNAQVTANSLEPLAQLENLEDLELSSLKVLEGGLRPLARCKALKRLHVSNQFAIEDYAYLAGGAAGHQVQQVCALDTVYGRQSNAYRQKGADLTPYLRLQAGRCSRSQVPQPSREIRSRRDSVIGPPVLVVKPSIARKKTRLRRIAFPGLRVSPNSRWRHSPSLACGRGPRRSR